MKQPIPEAILQQHVAFLGKTGSGKTSTAKLAVEQIVRGNPAARVCILDPIKSDWWGLTSSADGKRPGLPFHILGGPRGHVPLHDTAGKVIGELVATGQLPLSIIDMADFNAGGLQKFFNDFAPALLKKIRGVVYLVIEEAHEFAPKERSGIGAESMAIHFAKKLATAGRSKGIRMMVLTQRTQALHNALLGSCDTMIAHRLTAPADQEPVKKWLKANVDKEIFEKVSASLSSLKTGSGWICSGEAQVADLVQFPKISTYDNSATPTGEMADLDIKTAPVDRDKLRSIIGEAVTQAEADDPTKLRTEIAALRKEMAAKSQITQSAAPDPKAIDAAYLSGISAGRGHILGVMRELGSDIETAVKKHTTEASRLADKAFDESQKSGSPPSQVSRPPAKLTAPTRAVSAPRGTNPSPAASGDGSLSQSLQRVVNAIGWWRKIGFDPVERARASVVAGFSPKASTFGVYIAELVKLGLVATGNGKVSLTEEGWNAAVVPEAGTADELRVVARGLLSQQEARVFDVIYDAYPNGIARKDVAEQVGLSPTASTTGVYIAGVAAYGVIEVSSPGHVKAAEWLFP